MTWFQKLLPLLLLLIGKEKWIAQAIACYKCNLFPHESEAACPGKRIVNFGWQFDVSDPFTFLNLR